MFLSTLYLMTSNYDPGACFSKVPETFRARKAVFSPAVLVCSFKSSLGKEIFD